MKNNFFRSSQSLTATASPKNELGERVDQSILENFFIVGEGEGNIIIGKIRQGKSYAATRMIWNDLYQGKTVYATWPVVTELVDDRDELRFVLRGLFLPWFKRFFVIPTSENFHYINADTGEVDGVPTFQPTTKGYIAYLNTLNHCTLYIDESWRILNHILIAKNDVVDVFNLILVTGHKFRTVYVISQRLAGINPTFRDNANRLFRCTKLLSLFGFTRFKLEEFQEWDGAFIAPDRVPDSIETYWGDKKIFKSYNSWYYGKTPPLHELKYWAYDLTYREKIIALYRIAFNFFLHFLRKN